MCFPVSRGPMVERSVTMLFSKEEGILDYDVMGFWWNLSNGWVSGCLMGLGWLVVGFPIRVEDVLGRC